ncbi:von Willebrand factor A domain-containing protein 3B [Pelodytes ibericus]
MLMCTVQNASRKTEFSSTNMDSKIDTDAMVSSSTWLQYHGLKKKKLYLQKILAQLGFQQKEDYVNKLGRPISSRYAHGLFHQFNSDGKIYNLTAKREHVLQKIESVTEVIGLYEHRLDWLAGGSRAIFGVIQEKSAIFVLDINAVSKVQYNLCRDAFCRVLREQVTHISKFNLIWLSQIPVQWHQNTVRATQESIEAAVEWIWNLPYSTVDLESSAKALSQALHGQVEAIYYYSVGDIPQPKKLLLSQTILSCPCPVHAVCYNAQKTETITFWKELSHQSRGRFHIYFEKNKHTGLGITQNEEYSTVSKQRETVHPECDLREDEQLIQKELSEAQYTLQNLQDILKTYYEPGNENINQSTQEAGPEDCVSSQDWLKKYGLKPQKLRFYDALADCAFRHSDGVVDIKTKPEDESVQTDAENKMKLINAKYCDQFVHALWKDGSVVHVYVSKEKCRWYEEKMTSALELIRRRIKWLQKGSRELFGSILEDQIYILIDTSHSMKDKLFLVKKKIFQLMQEQIKSKRMFNFVKFDSKVEAWKSRLVDVNENNLQDAWFWVKKLQVGSSTNTLRALQVALTDTNTQAVYLLTDGRPDQTAKSILAQVNLQKRVPVHTISFNCDDTEANNFLHQLSIETGGRFHCYNRYLKDPDVPQPFVSEDIHLLLKEIEMGKADLEKIQKVHTECLMLDWYHNGEKDLIHMPFQFHNQKAFGRSQSAYELTTDSKAKPLSSKAKNSPPLHQPSVCAAGVLLRQKVCHAEQTKSSLLRALSHGVRLCESSAKTDMPMETRDLFLINEMKATSVLKEFKIIPDATSHQYKPKRLPKTSLDISSARWLKTHSLVARKLTIMDALAPTTVPHTAKYVPVLNKHILAKVYDEVLPLAHVSGNGKPVLLINPQAVNLDDYKKKLSLAIEYFERRLNLVIWRALSQKERDKFESDIPVSYLKNKDALLQALDRLAWPIPVDDVMLLEEEIEAGKMYLQQASDLQDYTKDALMSKMEELKNENKKVKQKKKELDTLKNQKVIARSDVDGFYYKGTVVRSINSKHALVDFCQGENQIIPIKFIIQTGGALPCPPLKVGDFVFSRTGAGSGCYVPAVVIATPRPDIKDKLYSVLKYNNRKEHCLRSELIKISPSKFAFSCRYIRKAQLVDFLIPNVQIVKPLLKPTPPKEDSHKRTKKGRRHSRSDEKLVADHVISLKNGSREEETKPQTIDIEKKLEDLALKVTQYQEEQKDQQQTIQEYLKELAVLKSHQDKCPSEKEQKDLAQQQIDLLQQLKAVTPISSIQEKHDLSQDHILVNQPKAKNNYVSSLVPGQMVLALCSHNGWYEKGSIFHDCGDFSYFVQRSSGEMSRVWGKDIVSDADDYNKDIQEQDPVIAPHPKVSGSYCPGVVLRVMPDLKLMIRYYDHAEDLVTREQVYSISTEKFERDTAYILDCEERWIGQAVVARNDETGTFHLAEVQKRVGNGKQYIICWTDGKTVIQDIKWIFGKFSKPHVLNVSAHVLTLASPSSLTFLPGIITELHGTKLHIEFCNGKSCQNVEPHHCFGLSESRFHDAVQFYQDNNGSDETSGDDTIYENEDSQSDISSITLTSVDSDRGSQSKD